MDRLSAGAAVGAHCRSRRRSTCRCSRSARCRRRGRRRGPRPHAAWHGGGCWSSAARCLLTAFAAREMGLVLDIARPDRAADHPAAAVRRALRLDRAVLRQRGLWLRRAWWPGGGRRLGIDPRAPLPKLSGRTALLMPVYNEPPERVMAGLQAVHESLAAAGAAAHFDIFILSDTTDPDAWVAEEAAFLALRERTGDQQRIFYRRRPKNTERKAGNIAEWVQRFGGAYPAHAGARRRQRDGRRGAGAAGCGDGAPS